MEEAGRLLRENIPPQTESTIVHGDFRIGNFIVRDHHISAVLDWELCTLGDPRADMAWVLNWWYSADEIELGKGDSAPTAAGGFPSREELVAFYERATGRDLSRVNYFRALSSWKLATIAQGVYRRYAEGMMGETSAAELSHFKQRFSRHARLALDLLNQ